MSVLHHITPSANGVKSLSRVEKILTQSLHRNLSCAAVGSWRERHEKTWKQPNYVQLTVTEMLTLPLARLNCEASQELRTFQSWMWERLAFRRTCGTKLCAGAGLMLSQPGCEQLCHCRLWIRRNIIQRWAEKLMETNGNTKNAILTGKAEEPTMGRLGCLGGLMMSVPRHCPVCSRPGGRFS